MKTQSLKISLLVGFALFLNNAHTQIFVNLSSTSGANNGSTWIDAYLDLQNALDEAHSTDTIWIAQGIYHPTEIVEGADSKDLRNKSFHVTGKNIAIYGGFSGTEISIEERDVVNSPTVFSGDFNGDDIITDIHSENYSTNNNENAYHVFILSEIGHSTLDGVIIKGGNADDNGGFYNYGGSLLSSSRGGGIYAKNNSSFSVIKIINCVISGNSSAHLGGGIFSDSRDSTSIVLINSIISNNTSSSQGGGIYSSSFLGSYIQLTNSLVTDNLSFMGGGIYSNSGPSSTVLLSNSTVSNNSAEVGAGIFSYSLSSSSVAINNSTIDNNLGLDAAGGILSASELFSSVSIVNSTVSNNSAFEGGGILSESYNPFSSSSVVISNSTISNNLANEGSGILSINYDSLSSSTIAVASSVIWTAEGSGSNISNNGSPSIVSKGNNFFSDTPIGILKSDSVNVSKISSDLQPVIHLANNSKTKSRFANNPTESVPTYKERGFVSANKNGAKRFGPQSLSSSLNYEEVNDSYPLTYILVNNSGLDHNMDIEEITVTAIPSSEKVLVYMEDMKDGQYIIELQDARGRLLSELLINSNSTPINLGGYERGVYLIRISNNTRHSIYRLIKDK